MPYLPTGRRVVAVLAGLLVVFSLAACAPEEPKDEPTYAPEELKLSQVETSTVPAEKLLTAADVEKVSKIKGVQAVAQGASERATGNLNFANDKGGIFLVVTLGNKELFEQSKGTDSFREKVAGVADDAFSGPAKSKSAKPNQLILRKGNDSAAITVFFSGPDKTVLTMDQLKELGNIIAERF